MDRNVQRSAQERVNRIAGFRAELGELEREIGPLLTAEQRLRLDAHLDSVLAALNRECGVDVTESAQRISWGMRVAAFLGAAALCAAIVLFLHRIWGVLPPSAHAPVLAVLPVVLVAAAEFSFCRGAGLYYTALIGLAAGAGFVAELSVLGSTYNLAPSPHALLVWGSFAVLVAYAFGLRLLLGAGLILLCAYTAAIWVSALGWYWPAFLDRMGFMLPAAAVLYAVPALRVHRGSSDFDFVYRISGAATALTALLVLSKRGDLCCSPLTPGALEALYQVLGVGLSVGVVCHGLALARSGLVNLGAAGFVVFLFVRLHAWWWHWMPKYLFFLLLGILAFLLLFVFRRLRARLGEGGGP